MMSEQQMEAKLHMFEREMWAMKADVKRLSNHLDFTCGVCTLCLFLFLVMFLVEVGALK